jgi:hypothetical protein
MNARPNKRFEAMRGSGVGVRLMLLLASVLGSAPQPTVMPSHERRRSHAQLGHFVLTFQALEASMVELTVQVVNAHPDTSQPLRQSLSLTARLARSTLFLRAVRPDPWAI